MPSKAVQLLVSSTERKFRKAYLALAPTALDLSYSVHEVTAEPSSAEMLLAMAPVSVMTVSKKAVSSV